MGDGIFVVSNPRGYEGTFSQGIMSAIRREGEIDVVQISAPISHASSGGPVLNASGQVIGVASALVDGEQSINFALPASLVAQLLARVNPTALAESLPAALDRASPVFAEPGRSTPPDLTYEPRGRAPAWTRTAARARISTMRRVLLAVLVVLAVVEAGCRTPNKDPNDTQRVEQR